jgi:hypothetical protein
MKINVRFAALAAVALVLAAVPSGVIGQTGTPAAATPAPSGRQDREARIQEHQERIRKILEESNRRRTEAQQGQQGATPPAAPGSPGAQNNVINNVQQQGRQPQGAAVQPYVQPGQPIPTGPIQNARMTPPIQKATPTPGAAAPQTARSESRTILLFHPLDSLVKVGDEFKTDLVAETKEGEIDEISILLHYPRHVLSPLALDHAPIDPYVKSKIDYEFNPDEGTIYIHTKLEKPMRFTQSKIFSIVWEALEESDGAVISYEFSKPHTTGLYLKGSNLLGTLPGAEDGVIRTTVQVIGPEQKPTITELEDNDIMIGARPPVTRDDRPNENIALDMRGPERTVKAGETFDVGIYVRNPGEKRMDRIRLYLQFNPAELQVVDYDAGNIVTRGINIHDGDSRDLFPFEYYKSNSADNTKGTIMYEVSAANTRVRGTGKLATVRMKALKETPRAELVMVQNAKGLSPTTSVSFMGQFLLKNEAPVQTARAMKGVAVQVSGRAVAAKGEDKSDIYNPFESNLARRMREAGQ